MAILQGLVALVTRSLGSILSALFGWAVVALFGMAAREKREYVRATAQKLGLSDEELESWSKARGFRVEPAGHVL